MTSHARQQIREEVAGVITGLALTGSRVFQSRVYPLERNDLPCLIVTTDSDEIRYLSETAPAKMPARIERETVVRIHVYAKATANLDDQLDDVCHQVEIAMANYAGNSTWRFNGTEVELSALGEQPIGVATLTYRIKTYHAEND